MSRIGKIVKLLFLAIVFGLFAILIYGAFRPCCPNVYAEETRYSMKIIMTAVEEYDRDQASNGAAALTADVWVPPLVVAPKSRDILARLDKNAWSVENKYELRDAWGNAIGFIPNGGPGGKHQLISAGPDGDMTTEEDNVRYPK